MAASCILHDTVWELWTQINTIHHLYLTQDNLLSKMKHRNNLQKYILEFLCIVPHHQKFNFRETSETLHRSIQKVKSCNILKSANAWVGLAAYASNLYTQPWRKEFYEIRTYCGFYKHQIENCLIGAERILEIMGYERKSDHKLVFNVSTDPELISAASRDSIIALTECQVIFAIYKEVSKKVPTCTLLDILDYRRSHVCSVEEAVHGIYYMHYRALNSICTCHHRDYYTQNCVPIPYVRYPQCCSGSHLSVKCYKNCNECCHTGRNGTVGSYRKNLDYNVPTEKLIDVDECNFHCHKGMKCYDLQPAARSKHEYSSSDISAADEYVDNKSNRKPESQIVDSDGTWDYVYRSLQNKESHADHAVNANQTKYAGTKSIRMSDAMSNLKVSEEELKKKYYDTIDTSKSAPSYRDGSKVAFDPTKRSKTMHPSSNLSNSKLKSSDSDRWECGACTYHNAKKNQICDMCGKSKNSTSEIKPLVSGGKQCPNCTLVNDKDASECEVCTSSLKDSPTYI